MMSQDESLGVCIPQKAYCMYKKDITSDLIKKLKLKIRVQTYVLSIHNIVAMFGTTISLYTV